MKKVTIKDDTLRANRVHVPTDAERISGRVPAHVPFLLVKDDQGRQVQDKIVSERTYEGRHLEIAVRRAKRYLRKARPGRPPRHVMHALMAYAHADPKGFKGERSLTAYTG